MPSDPREQLKALGEWVNPRGHVRSQDSEDGHHYRNVWMQRPREGPQSEGEKEGQQKVQNQPQDARHEVQGDSKTHFSKRRSCKCS